MSDAARAPTRRTNQTCRQEWRHGTSGDVRHVAAKGVVMAKQLLGETLIIVAGTLFFFGLAATVGIPGNERKAATAVAAEEVAPVRGVPAEPQFGDIPGPFGRGWER